MPTPFSIHVLCVWVCGLICAPYLFSSILVFIYSPLGDGFDCEATPSPTALPSARPSVHPSPRPSVSPSARPTLTPPPTQSPSGYYDKFNYTFPITPYSFTPPISGDLHRILVMLVRNQRRRVLYKREKETVEIANSGRRKRDSEWMYYRNGKKMSGYV